MAITWTAGAVATSTGTVTTISVPLPSGLATGDVILCAAATNSSSGGFTTAPAGWSTLVANTDSVNGSTSAHGVMYWKAWASGDTAPTLTFGSGRVGAQCVKVTGADPATLVDVAPTLTQAAASTTTVSAPSVTPGVNSSLLCFFVARDPNSIGAPVWTPPPGMTEVAEAGGTASATTNASFELAVLDVSAGTATGAKTATADKTVAGGFGYAMTLRPAAVGAPAGTISAALSGSGTLSATTTPGLTVAAALSGAGALSATVRPALVRAGALSGSGTLSATVTGSAPSTAGTVSAALSGVGTLSATLAPALTVAASLTGAGALTATVTATTYGWFLTTPTTTRRYRMAGSLLSTEVLGLSVWRTAGVWNTGLSPSADVLAAADRYYRGGCLHPVSPAERDELLAAGFTVTAMEVR